MKKKIIIGVVILVIVAIVIGTVIIKSNNGKSTEEGKTLIKMNEVTRSVFYAPQYAAISQGYFKEYGIEIDLTTGQRSRCCNDISIIR